MHSIFKALPIVASHLARRFGVKVLITNSDDPGSMDDTVVLPNNPNQLLIWGYLAHETGHVRESDFALFDSIENRFRKRLLNTVEDIRIELRMIRLFPGVACDLHNTVSEMDALKMWGLPEPDDAPSILLAKALYFGRSHILQQPLSEQHRFSDELFVAQFGLDLKLRLEALLDAVRGLNSTQSALELTDAIIGLFSESSDDSNTDSGSSSDSGSSQSQLNPTPAPSESGDSEMEPKESGEDSSSDDRGESGAPESDGGGQDGSGSEGSEDGSNCDSQNQNNRSDAGNRDSSSAGLQQGSNSEMSDGSSADDGLGAKDGPRECPSDEGDASKADPSESDSNQSCDGGGDDSKRTEGESESVAEQQAASTDTCSSSIQGTNPQSSPPPDSGKGSDPNASESTSSAAESCSGRSTLSSGAVERGANLSVDQQRNVSSLLAALASDKDGDFQDPLDTLKVKLFEGCEQDEVMGDVLLPSVDVWKGDGVTNALNEVLTATHALSAKLRRLLQASRDRTVRIARRGRKLSSKHLARVGVADHRIYRAVQQNVEPNTDVHLLVDMSGSMKDRDKKLRELPFELASKAALALALGLEKVNGVSTAVTYFCGKGDIVYEVLRFGESAKRNAYRFGFEPYGGTPLHNAIWYAASELALRNCGDRKIVVVVTDGKPSSPDATKYIVNRCRSSGVEFIGVGIGNGAASISSYFERSVVLESIEELPDALFDLIRRALVVKAA